MWLEGLVLKTNPWLVIEMIKRDKEPLKRGFMKPSETFHPYQEHRSEWYHWKEEEVYNQISWTVSETSQPTPRILHLNLGFFSYRTYCMITTGEYKTCTFAVKPKIFVSL